MLKDINLLLQSIKRQAVKHKFTLCIGRSHGIHAEPITFGLKMLTFYQEFLRNKKRLENSINEISTCAISGAVGTFANIDPRVESFVAKKLKLNVEPISTQIIPRDRHAQFFSTLGIIASSIERFATEIRHLQRTEVLEVESGRKNKRPKLAEAIALCEAYQAVLLVAKFDRLSRDAYFLLGLQKAGVKFVAADNPQANELTVGILALVAQNEAKAISERTKAALAAAKARGVKLGGFRGRAGTKEDCAKATRANMDKADERAKKLQLLFDRLNPDRTASYKEMARRLNADGVPTLSGKGQWRDVQVARVYKRLAA